MFFQHFDWNVTHHVLSLYILPSHHMNLRDQPWRLEDAHNIRWCRTDICSCKPSAKVSLMLDNPFLVPSLCKLNHISLCFIQISTKSPAELLFPFRESTVFWGHPRCFGPLSKFQHNIKIFIKTTCVSRLPVSCDYDDVQSDHLKNLIKAGYIILAQKQRKTLLRLLSKARFKTDTNNFIQLNGLFKCTDKRCKYNIFRSK